jgi:hypothetical protein
MPSSIRRRVRHGGPGASIRSSCGSSRPSTGSDHTYEGVKRDFESYAPLVRPGGVVALHDIVPNRIETTSQVELFWREVKDGRSVKELIAD